MLAVATFALSIGQPLHLGTGLLSTAIAIAGIATVLVAARRGSSLDWAPRPLAAELWLDRPFSRWVPALGAGAARPGGTVEGVATARAACQLGARTGVELPIAAAVADVLDGALTVEGAMEALLARPLREE